MLLILIMTRYGNGQGNGLGVAVDLGDVCWVGAGAVGAENGVVVAVAVGLNILGGKLLVAAVRAARRILTIDVHLQQDRQIQADLQRAADPELRRGVP